MWYIFKVNINGQFGGVYILPEKTAKSCDWNYISAEFKGTKEECEAEAKRWNWKILDYAPKSSEYVDNDLWHDF
jgi:hypothetical protein